MTKAKTATDKMTEAELEEHLIALSARRDALVAEIKAEAKAARAALDRKIQGRRADEALAAAGLPHVKVDPASIEASLRVGGE